MEVLMLGWEYPPNIEGGMGAHLYHLANGLAAQDIRMTVILPCCAKDKKNLEFKHVRFPRREDSYWQFLSSVRRYNKRICQAAPALIRDKKIKVIHAHDWITFESAVWLKERTGAKLVATFHSTEYDRNEHADGKSRMAKLERLAAKKADAIIAVSKMVKDTLIKRYGADRKKIKVIPNGPSIKKFPKTKEKCSVLFAGRLAGQKGAEHLISAIPKVEQKCTFVVCGQGHLREPLLQYADALGVSDRLLFTGFLTQKKLARAYAQCSVFVSSSLREPFGISLLDAMRAGKACVATRRTGLLEFVPKNACITVKEKRPEELARAISLLLADKSMRGRLGKKAKAASKELDWKRTCAQTITVYKQLDSKVL